MQLDIFNVEHGACSLVTTSNGKRIMIDAGHNATTGWKPGSYLKSSKISQIDELIITNYDEDHVSGIGNLFDYLYPGVLVRNRSVSPQDLKRLKSEDGMGPGIDRLVKAMTDIYTGGAPSTESQDFGDTTFKYFNCNYPIDFEDENNLSFVTFVSAGPLKAIFPGDLETAGWRKLLERAAFVSALKGVNVFFASHHGRENGYCKEVFDFCSPDLIVISDSSIKYETQKVTGLYAKHAKGVRPGSKRRYVVTTRNDGNMTFKTGTNGEGQSTWFLNMDSDV